MVALRDPAGNGKADPASSPSPGTLSPEAVTEARDRNEMNAGAATADLVNPKPASLPSQAPAFSYERQSKLRDEMLALPMPSSREDPSHHLDAEAFNNSALILSRQPENQYADSVQQFLEDVKNRDPDQTRLQILSTMYENYLAGLANQ